MNRAAIKLEAKEKIREIRGSYVCIALIIFATSLIISLAANGIGSDQGASLLTSAFNLFVAPMMSMAVLFFAVQGWRGNTPRTGDWMNAVFERYGRKLGGYLWMALKIILWMLPFAAAIVLYASIVDLRGVITETARPAAFSFSTSINFRYTYQTGLMRYSPTLYITSDDAMKLIVPGLIYLAMMVALIRVSYSYFFTTYVLAACPNVGARDAVKLSVKMTKGYRRKIFVTELSFLGWSLLSVLTFGILLLVYVGPYVSLTFAGMFDTIKKEGIESGRLTYADFGEEAPETEKIEDGDQA